MGKISSLPSDDTVDGTDVIPVVSNGATKKVTVTDLVGGTAADSAIAAIVGDETSATAAALTAQYLSTLGLPNGTDDTATIQAALDAAPVDGVVRCQQATYKVSQAGTKNGAMPSGTVSLPYGILVPSGVTFDLNGATLLAIDANGADFIVVMNSEPASGNSDLAVINGTIDGADLGGTTSGSIRAGILLAHVTRPTVRNVRFTRHKRVGFSTLAIVDSEYDRITADDVDGNGMMLGNPAATFREVGGRWGELSASTCSPWSPNTTNFPGNSVYISAEKITIGVIKGTSCTGGAKVGYPSVDIQIGRVEVMDDGDGSANSGCKIQGDAAGSVSRITVGQVLARGCAGSGLYIDQYSTDITIGHFMGFSNATLGTFPDVWLGGQRVKIESIATTNTGQAGIELRSTSSDLQIGRAMVRNGGQVVGSGGTSPGLNANGGATSAVFESFIAIDDQGTATMRRGADVGATAVLTIHDFKAVGNFGSAPLTTTAGGKFYIGRPRCHATDPLVGEITPTAAATSTVITNGNFRLINGLPVVEIEPINSAARSLTGVHYTYAANTLTIKHSAAVGTEVLRWRLVAYVPGTAPT